MKHAKILGIGSALPEKVLTNHDLEKMVDTSDEWIRTRTGICQRHICEDSDSCTDLSWASAQKALESAEMEAADLDMIIVATLSGDLCFPSAACLLQQKLGCYGVMSFDVNAACAGFLYALTCAYSFIQSGQARHVLVVGTEIISRVIDWTDRTTCILFGDGSGAFILGAHDKPGILAAKMRCDSQYADILGMSGRLRHGKLVGDPYIRMNGQAVFKAAVRLLEQSVEEILELAKINKSDVDLFIPHQANLRIIETLAEKLDLPMERVVVTIAQHGNTSSASIPIVFDHAVKTGRLVRGQRCIVTGIGSGLVWGSVALEY